MIDKDRPLDIPRRRAWLHIPKGTRLTHKHGFIMTERLYNALMFISAQRGMRPSQYIRISLANALAQEPELVIPEIDYEGDEDDGTS